MTVVCPAVWTLHQPQIPKKRLTQWYILLKCSPIDRQTEDRESKIGSQTSQVLANYFLLKSSPLAWKTRHTKWRWEPNMTATYLLHNNNADLVNSNICQVFCELDVCREYPVSDKYRFLNAVESCLMSFDAQVQLKVIQYSYLTAFIFLFNCIH